MMLENTAIQYEVPNLFYGARRDEQFEDNFEIHLHDAYEIYHLKEGQIVYFVEGTHYTAKPGDIFITNAKELHTPIIEQGCYDRQYIQFTKYFLSEMISTQTSLLKAFENRGTGQLNKIDSHLCAQYGLHDLFAKIEAAIQCQDSYQSVEVTCLMGELLININRLFEKELLVSGKEIKQNEKVKKILKYINDNLFSKITLEDIQKEFFVNRYYLCHLFKKNTGVSIYEYIINKRIMAAKRLILEKVPLVQVCYEVGFNDYSSFYKAFVKLENKSPKQFLKENSGVDEGSKGTMAVFKLSGFSDEIDTNLDIQIESLKKLGIPHMEIRGVNGKNIADVTLEEAQAIKAELDKNEIKISAIGSPIGKIGIRDNFETEMKKFQNVLEVSKILEAPYIRMFSFFMPKGEDPEQHFEEVVARWKQYIEAAKDYDVILLHENEKGIYGDTGARCEKLIKAIQHPKVGVTFDPANFVQVNQNVMEAYELLKPYITYMHIKDADANHQNVPSGEGIGQVKEVLQALKAANYEGFLSLEPHLASFEGRSALEQEGFVDEETARKSHSYYVFKKAYDALKSLM